VITVCNLFSLVKIRRWKLVYFSAADSVSNYVANLVGHCFVFKR